MVAPNPAQAERIDRSGCPGRGKHGTVAAAMKRGCRCPDARERRRIYRKRQREGRLTSPWVAPFGTARRLRALNAAGWPIGELAARMACTRQNVALLWRADERGVKVTRVNAARVAALYRELSTVPGPSSSAAKRAASRGWATPQQWDGADLDDPLALSDLEAARVDHTDQVSVLWEDVEFLMSPMGGSLSDERIAERLRCTVDAVQACRRRARHAAATFASGHGKLSDEQVHEVRARYLREVVPGLLTRRQLADAYGIGTSRLCHILAGKVRPHLCLSDLTADNPQRGRTGRKRRPTTPSPIPTKAAAPAPRTDGGTDQPEVAA
jgi:hypothetical protein